MNKIVCFCGSTILFCATGMVAGAAEQSADTLPQARSGECYAKVSVPAVYKIEEFEVEIKEGTETIAITPAAFKTMTEKVMVREAYTKLEPVPAVYETVAARVRVSDEEQAWMRQVGDEGDRVEWPASKGLLSDLVDAGIDLEQTDVDTCFYEHLLSAGYEDLTQQVLVADASDRVSFSPAEFATVSKQILRKPAYQKLQAEPASYVKATEDVIVEAAHSAWKPGRGPIERIDNTTGEIMCRVDIPAVYETIDTEVITEPAGVKATRVPAVFDSIEIETLVKDAVEIREPVAAQFDTIKKMKKISDARYRWLPQPEDDDAAAGQFTGNAVCLRQLQGQFKTVERRVLKTPATFKRVEVPAQYEEIEVEKLVSRASEQRTPVAAKTRPMIRRVKVSDARLEWRPVLCETNMSDEIVKEIQQALNDRGYNAGKVDGVLGSGTMRAIENYQEDENLALGGLTYSTLESLEIEVIK
ncbi:MAG: peptidoglycan-binding protein [Gammaproteobacteria bacterium]|nr:peptidoglycan-binding protein [Gammaproteobacteria bacterium]